MEPHATVKLAVVITAWLACKVRALPATAAGSSVRPSVAKGAVAPAEVQQAGAGTAAQAADTTNIPQPGCLRVRFSVNADVATRDWLRSGELLWMHFH